MMETRDAICAVPNTSDAGNDPLLNRVHWNAADESAIGFDSIDGIAEQRDNENLADTKPMAAQTLRQHHQLTQKSSWTLNVQQQLVKTKEDLRRIGLSHLAYMIGLIVLTVLGGAIFYAVDKDAGDQAIADYDARCRAEFEIELSALQIKCENTTLSHLDCMEAGRNAMIRLDNCHRNYAKHRPSLPMSDFKNAIIFAATVYTTIGINFCSF